jgi:hypothetical protein
MESYDADDSLETYRRDTIHREGMCAPLGEHDDRFDPITEATGQMLVRIDAKRDEVQHAEDLLIRASAAEKAMRIRTSAAYKDVRLRLAADAADRYRTILPITPSAVGSAGIKRCVTIVERSIVTLRDPSIPELIRTVHVPVLEAELGRLRTADLAEDEVAANMAALRIAVALFKTGLEKDRQAQYGELVKIVGKQDADEFFLSTRRTRTEKEPVLPTPGG